MVLLRSRPSSRPFAITDLPPADRAILWLFRPAPPGTRDTQAATPVPAGSASTVRESGSVRRGVPVLGEHTREVLAELGYSDEQVKDLVRSGATACR